MLAVTSINGLGLTQGADFACNATICFARDSEVDVLFMELQRAANAFVPLLNALIPGQAKLLTVDGFIGASTVALVNRLALFPIQQSTTIQAPPKLSKEDIARNAFNILAAYNQEIAHINRTRTFVSGIDVPSGLRTPIAPTGTPTRKPGTTTAPAALPAPSIVTAPSPAPLPTVEATVPKPFFKRPGVLVAAGMGAVGLVGLLVLASVRKPR